MINRINKDDDVPIMTDGQISEDWIKEDLINIDTLKTDVNQLKTMVDTSTDIVSKNILYCKIISKLNDLVAYIIVYKDKTTTTIISENNLEVAFMQEYFHKYGISIYK